MMNLSSTLILAFGMSMDAFAASVGKGATLHKPPLREALRTGLIFGVIEACTPLIGWSLGMIASRYIMAWDHWIAFTLLGCLGYLGWAWRRRWRLGIQWTSRHIGNPQAWARLLIRRPRPPVDAVRRPKRPE